MTIDSTRHVSRAGSSGRQAGLRGEVRSAVYRNEDRSLRAYPLGYARTYVTCYDASRLLPIRARSIVVMDVICPPLVRHGGPMIFIEPGCVFQLILVHVENEAVVLRIELQRAPRHGEQLATHSKN